MDTIHFYTKPLLKVETVPQYFSRYNPSKTAKIKVVSTASELETVEKEANNIKKEEEIKTVLINEELDSAKKEIVRLGQQIQQEEQKKGEQEKIQQLEQQLKIASEKVIKLQDELQESVENVERTRQVLEQVQASKGVNKSLASKLGKMDSTFYRALSLLDKIGEDEEYNSVLSQLMQAIREQDDDIRLLTSFVDNAKTK